MRFHLILISGGVGKRYDSKIPKQYTISSNGETIIFQSIKPFIKFKNVISTLTIVCESSWVKFIEKINFNLNCPIYFVNSGESREDSIFNGLSFLDKKLSNFNENDYILLQEAVRPFIQTETIRDLIESNPIMECVAPVLNPLTLHGNFDYDKKQVTSLFNKSKIVELSLPRRYSAKKFLLYFNNYRNQSTKKELLDEGELFLWNNVPINCVKGSFKDIKITVPIHRYIMDGIIKNNEEN